MKWHSYRKHGKKGGKALRNRHDGEKMKQTTWFSRQGTRPWSLMAESIVLWCEKSPLTLLNISSSLASTDFLCPVDLLENSAIHCLKSTRCVNSLFMLMSGCSDDRWPAEWITWICQPTESWANSRELQLTSHLSAAAHTCKRSS